jgi:hypothetical protein
MDWEVEAGAIVIADAFRSVGIYGDTLDRLRYVAEPVSGVAPVHVTPYISDAGAPLAVPAAVFGPPKILLNIWNVPSPVCK